MMTRRAVCIVIGVLVFLALSTTVVLASDGDPPADITGTGDATNVLLTALAPIIAIATSVERAMEMFWDRWEKSGTWPHKQGVSDTKSPKYVSSKQVGSQVLGTVFAFVAVGLTNARFFRLLGLDVLFSNLMLFDINIGGIVDDFTVGTLVDWVMTSAVIGWGGTELTHSIIEGLVKGRNLWKEMREVEAGRKSILDAKFFNDYIAPELEKRGVSVAMLRQAFQALNSAGVSADQLISSMTIGKVDELAGQLEAKPETSEAAKAVRALLEGVPAEKAVEVPDVLALLTPDQRERFLGI
ncbi:MAG: hypothetical protein JXA14_14175 [Anaerolineae bacterium]|nr:hypothetical protein [Anaerolineae bacterium]